MANAQQIEFLNAGLGTAYGLGWVYSYESGTTTNKTVYTSADKLANAANPFQLDANGRATVYAEGNYTLLIKDVNLANAITLNNLYYSVYSSDNPNVVSKSADYTTTSTDYLILVNTAAGNITITPVTAVGNSGVEHLIIKTSADANTVIIDPTGSQTIGGSSTKTLSVQYQSLGIMSDNANWQMTTTPGVVTLTGTETLTNKTLTSPIMTGPVMTVPQIQDTSSDHQYVFAVSELAADRTVTLPLLTAADEFVFKAHAQTLTNKTLTTPVITGWTPPSEMRFLIQGAAATGTKIVQALAGRAMTITKVKIYSDVKPTGTGTALTVDVNKNGTTIFTDQGKRPSVTVAGGLYADDSDTPDVTAIAEGDRISIDIDAVGDTITGGNDLLVTVVTQ